jgi:hypothetical protein
LFDEYIEEIAFVELKSIWNISAPRAEGDSAGWG